MERRGKNLKDDAQDQSEESAIPPRECGDQPRGERGGSVSEPPAPPPPHSTLPPGPARGYYQLHFLTAEPETQREGGTCWSSRCWRAREGKRQEMWVRLAAAPREGDRGETLPDLPAPAPGPPPAVTPFGGTVGISVCSHHQDGCCWFSVTQLDADGLEREPRSDWF